MSKNSEIQVSFSEKEFARLRGRREVTFNDILDVIKPNTTYNFVIPKHHHCSRKYGLLWNW